MKMTSYVFAAAVVTAAFLPFGAAQAQTKITVGKIVGGIGLHIPSYIAMDKGFFKEEGLDARWIELQGRPMITAGLTGNLDFVPIPSGGANAVLTAGAPLRYIVNQSLKPQYIIVAKPEIKKVEDLKGKTLGYARVGAADYDEGATTLDRFFNMKVGRDYKVIQFQGEPERIAALSNGDIAAALVSVPRAYQAKQAGFTVVLRTGLPAARRRRVLVHRRLLQEESRNGEEVHPRHRQGRDVLPRQQGRLLRQHEAAPRRQERRGGRRAVGRAAQHLCG
jgi:ABC-type nitrate/sulfonate/bicarbonate transport system substrate-binding protein